jgi:PAS domain S-box-containing protein
MKTISKPYQNIFHISNIKLKTQIILGYLFLLFLILFLILTSLFSLNKLDKSSEKIIKENYISIEAGLEMNKSLMILNNLSLKVISCRPEERTLLINKIDFQESEFEKRIEIAQNNITESGEYEIVQNLKREYKEYSRTLEKFKDVENNRNNSFYDLQLQYKSVLQNIIDLIEINHRACLEKNGISRSDFKAAWINLILIGLTALLLAYLTILKIPQMVIKPLETITKKIIEISEGNFSQILEIKTNNELRQLSQAFNLMSKKLYEYQQSNMSIIIAQKSRIESIVNSLNDAIIVLDEKKNFVLINPKAIQILDINDKDLIGKSAEEISKDNNLMKELLKVIDCNDSFQIERPGETLIKFYENEKEEYYSREIIKVYDVVDEERNNFLGYIIELKNVTDFKEIDDAKSTFISTLSHEVKTPLSAMNMSLSLLLNNKVGNLNNDQEKIIISMKDEIQRLLSIISNLFDLSKFETGNFRIRFQKTDFNFLLNYSITPFYNQIKEKDIYLEIKNDCKIKEIRVDPEKISWVLMNLIGNAIKYTPDHGTLKIDLLVKNNIAQFCVEDSGPGIDPKYLDRIFEKYFQVPVKGQVNEEGLGLGLAICKEIIQSHKGKIWAESEVGKGTRIYFTIPISIV